MLSRVDKLYEEVFSELEPISNEYEVLTGGIEAQSEHDRMLIERRKKNLKDQIGKMDEYKEQIDAFAKVAERQLKSLNHLTIVPREIDFNKLRNWAMMIGTADPDEHGDDPYARRVHYLCKCNIAYLDKKKSEFESRLLELEGFCEKEGEGLEGVAIEEKAQLELRYLKILEGDVFKAFSEAIFASMKQNAEFDNLSSLARGDLSDCGICLGRRAKRMPASSSGMKEGLARALGGAYDETNGYVYLPLCQPSKEEIVCSIECIPSKNLKDRLFCAVQRYILSSLAVEGIGFREFYLFDALHFNSVALGGLRAIEGTLALKPIPRSEEQFLDSLKEVVASFSDVDDVLGLEDSVSNYNLRASSEEAIPHKALIVIGSPSALPSGAKGYIERILYNHDRYGITVFLIDFVGGRRGTGWSGVVSNIAGNVFSIDMQPRRQTVARNDAHPCFFDWYVLNSDNRRIVDEAVKWVNAAKKQQRTLGNVYTDR